MKSSVIKIEQVSDLFILLVSFSYLHGCLSKVWWLLLEEYLMLFCSWEDYLVSCFCADLVKNGFVSVKIDLCGLSCAETHAYSTGCREQSWLDPSCRALLPQGINDI